MTAENKEDQVTSKLNFEQAITALNDVVGRIEDGRIPLAESIEQYERGMALIKRCRVILQDAEGRIEKIAAEGNRQDAPCDDAAGRKHLEGTDQQRTDDDDEQS